VNKYGINSVYFGLTPGDSPGKIAAKIGIKHKKARFSGLLERKNIQLVLPHYLSTCCALI
jgi:hypothetical protein